MPRSTATEMRDKARRAREAARAMLRAQAPAAPPAGNALTRLTGCGPGLAWLLGRAGAPDLSALARADAAALADRMGAAAGLLDLDGWIAEAARLRRAPNEPGAAERPDPGTLG